jgi:Holliday junction resolvasome RuvABC ATP-dependent DNA helicase subunit
MGSGEGKPTLRGTAAWITRENIARFYDEQGTDANGLDDVALRFLTYLKQQGAASEPTLRQALGLTHPKDFVEKAEYLVRLGLIETSSVGRRLTRQGERYLKAEVPPDLRSRISRAR